MTKVVVLDVDGTLMDTNYLHVGAWARAFEEVGHRVPRVQIHKQIGRGSGQLVAEFVDDEKRLSRRSRSCTATSTTSYSTTASRCPARRSSSPRSSSVATGPGSSPAPYPRSSNATRRCSGRRAGSPASSNLATWRTPSQPPTSSSSPSKGPKPPRTILSPWATLSET